MTARLRLTLALAAVAGVGALSGCTAAQQSEGVACAAALVASGQREPAALALVARATPACQALAADAVQWAIREAMLRATR